MHYLFARRAPIQYRLPWLPWPCIRLIDKWLRPDHTVFEWGAGGSTIYFLDRGCKVTTVESSPEWITDVSQRLRDGSGSRWTPILAHEGDQYATAIRRFADADLVLIDGLLQGRMECIAAVLRFASPRVIILDDSWRDEYAETPRILHAYDRVTCAGLGPARLGVSQADVYVSKHIARPAQEANRSGELDAVVGDAM
jgi:hypothetical protein